jgi:hypothetical protein
MNQEKTFDALNAIAEEIEAKEPAWLAAWEALNASTSGDAKTSGAKLVEDIHIATAALNEFIASKIPAVAEITGNNVGTLRMGLGPKRDLDVWFGGLPNFPASRFVRKVAEHRSFNEDFWAQEERRVEREAFIAKVDPEAQVVSADEAARIMKEGGVPCVAGDDFVRGRPLMKFEKEARVLSRLERAMVRAGLLEQYDKSWADRVSTTQSVAFLLRNKDGQTDGVYWTKGVARQRSEEFPFEPVVSESVMEAPRG